MRLGYIGNVYPEHTAEGRNQDAMRVYVDLNDRAVETLVFGKARRRDQTEEEEAEEGGEKLWSSVWHDALFFLREKSDRYYRTRDKWKQT